MSQDTRAEGDERIERDVSPLELFFDLVFVLAVAQLTHHLVAYLTWTGAAETMVMLVAVCGLWAFTSFEVTLLDIERAVTRALIIAVMGLGLFMNAGIEHAFEESPWLFAIPMLVALLGPAGYAAAVSPTGELREHFARVVVWVVVSAPFWVVGAASDHDLRLLLWAIAAGIDLLGAWTAHPLPGRRTQTHQHSFDIEHMLERMRLFLIILLGETVLSLGRVVSDHYADTRTILMALAGFVALVCLWLFYFGHTEEHVVEHASTTENPIRAVHLGINVIYGVVAGLVAMAAGTELLLAHPDDQQAGVAGVLVLGGPLLYVVAQAVYLGPTAGHGWLPRLVGAGVLGAAAVTAYWLPPYGVSAVLVVILLALAVVLARERDPAQA
jgi:low temperature requirement protein LtrA